MIDHDFKSRKGASLIETVVGGALVLSAGYLLTEASHRSVQVRDRLDDNVMMRRILDNVAAEVSSNSGFFVPIMPQGLSLHAYYACYSDEGTFQENSEESMEYGIFIGDYTDEIGKELKSHSNLELSFIKEEKLGFKKQGDPVRPCGEDPGYVAFAFPASEALNKKGESYLSYHAHIWVFALVGEDQIKSVLSDTVDISPI